MTTTGRLRTVLGVTTLLLTALLATGCGAAEDDAGSSSAPTSGDVAVTPSTSSTSLTVDYDDGQGQTKSWTLTCDPAGGSHPDTAAACAALDADGVKALQPPDPDQMCTMIYGGPQTARVHGTVEGKSVDATIDRKDGCGIQRWKALEGLLPEVSGAASPPS